MRPHDCRQTRENDGDDDDDDQNHHFWLQRNGKLVKIYIWILERAGVFYCQFNWFELKRREKARSESRLRKMKMNMNEECVCRRLATEMGAGCENKNKINCVLIKLESVMCVYFVQSAILFDKVKSVWQSGLQHTCTFETHECTHATSLPWMAFAWQTEGTLPNESLRCHFFLNLPRQQMKPRGPVMIQVMSMGSGTFCADGFTLWIAVKMLRIAAENKFSNWNFLSSKVFQWRRWWRCQHIAEQTANISLRNSKHDANMAPKNILAVLPSGPAWRLCASFSAHYVQSNTQTQTHTRTQTHCYTLLCAKFISS